jgi:hypothetical protein
MKELLEQFVESVKGTFLEEDRNSNFPSENTILRNENSQDFDVKPET